MLVIPAIDLRNSKVVRLQQGVFNKETIYHRDPLDVARAWVNAGAKRIHIVDLDGSVQGKGVNISVIKAICNLVDVDIEVGGGIRSEGDAARLIDLGVTFIILGTMVVEDRKGAKRVIERFPGRVAIGIDATDGKVAIHGWQDITDIDVISLAKDYEGLSPAFIVYTDIKRDGMLTGPNIEATSLLAREVNIPVVASGGVSSIEDLIALNNIPGLMGAITGKALYEGRVDLKEAISGIEQR
ncbi:MAG: 1-(5-phosphoribosyl)-5-[(5-phosphoribosylamino)methylideneamino]imidazole-4-carboxamide isomerase [Deltaproteobacteria bacterium]|nr:1-(5-phosphoribosyl)-5-[(5-phosphoribosylamino)methylideneamino]imidazole-4-carboxamide isomerase [Deltaproteobacteria bacterium]